MLPDPIKTKINAITLDIEGISIIQYLINKGSLTSKGADLFECIFL